MTHPLSSAQQRLAASRQAIVRDMQREGARFPDETDAHDGADTVDSAEAVKNTSSRPWGLVRQVACSWWQSHPVHLALDVAKPLMQDYAQAQPIKLLSIAAATGAAVVVLRPWRLISLTGVALALIKSTEVSGVVRSLLYGRPHDRQ